MTGRSCTNSKCDATLEDVSDATEHVVECRIPKGALEAVLCRDWAPPCGATGAMPSLSPIWWSMLPLIQCYADAGPRRAERTSAMPSLGPILWSTLSLIQCYADTGPRLAEQTCAMPNIGPTMWSMLTYGLDASRHSCTTGCYPSG